LRTSSGLTVPGVDHTSTGTDRHVIVCQDAHTAADSRHRLAPSIPIRPL